jgi:hypothetical protein
MQNNETPQPEDHDSLEVERPAWTNWVLVTWIAATAAIYYYNFTQTFYEENRTSIQTLFERLF